MGIEKAAAKTARNAVKRSASLVLMTWTLRLKTPRSNARMSATVARNPHHATTYIRVFRSPRADRSQPQTPNRWRSWRASYNAARVRTTGRIATQDVSRGDAGVRIPQVKAPGREREYRR